MSVEEIYQIISKFNITEDNVLDCLFPNGNDNVSHFYFRSMLLQLLENYKHLDCIIKIYYRTGHGPEIDNSRYVNSDGIVQNRREDSPKVEQNKLGDWLNIFYQKYERGFFETFKDLIAWSNEIESEFKNQGIEIVDERLMYIVKNYGATIRKEVQLLDDIERYTCSEDQYSPWCKNRLIELTNQELDKMKEDIEQAKEYFHSLGLDTIWKDFINGYKYYYKNGQPLIHALTLSDISLHSITRYLPMFKEDLYFCARIIQNQTKVLEIIRRGEPLNVVCEEIRSSMHELNPDIETDLRKIDVYNGLNDFMTNNSPSASEIQDAFKKLSEEYDRIMSETDSEKFINNCADFHHEFLKIHPFSDLNGRTSRILLTSMLASRDIFFPSLFSNTKDKDELYIRSDAALQGNFEILRNDVFMRLGYFMPNILPNNETDKDTRE